MKWTAIGQTEHTILRYAPGVGSISASKFKEQCLTLLDELDDQGIVITKRGRPVAKLVRVEPNSRNLIGALRAS